VVDAVLGEVGRKLSGVFLDSCATSRDSYD
jgi:hypothetical protein